MVSHCNLFNEAHTKEQSQQFSCPEDILNVDVLEDLNDKLFSGFKMDEPEPGLMSEEKNSRYRELVDSRLDSKCYHDFEI